jgi:thiosulfate/3-mercaptopyruvate sulfurtransferase
VTPLISADALRAAYDDPALRVVDCRFQLSDPAAGLRAYRAGHLPGAVFLDLERDLSDPVTTHGGRHPLPHPTRLAGTLSRLGIGNGERVVVYDDAGDMAPHAWWVLSWLGHPRVQVLDGGIEAWVRAGGTLTTEIPQHPPAVFVVALRNDWVTMDRHEIEAAAREGRLVDSRAGERYRGEVEPLDPVGGHIPGARHFDWRYAKDATTGTYLPPEDLARRFAALPPDGEPVVYCGSGVTACSNFLALTLIGRTPKVYAGSWSDWVSYPDRPVATGHEHRDPAEA